MKTISKKPRCKEKTADGRNCQSFATIDGRCMRHQSMKKGWSYKRQVKENEEVE